MIGQETAVQTVEAKCTLKGFPAAKISGNVSWISITTELDCYDLGDETNSEQGNQLCLRTLAIQE